MDVGHHLGVAYGEKLDQEENEIGDQCHYRSIMFWHCLNIIAMTMIIERMSTSIRKIKLRVQEQC